MSDSPYIHNVTAETFNELVIENSFKQPVLVDFWADWCNPCQALIPVLTKLAEEYKGAFILAKVNSDEQGQLATQAGVRSLPTVKLFIDGQIVNEFMGALPEGEVRNFLSPYIQSESDKVLASAITAFQQGNKDEAFQMLNDALSNDPQNVDLKVNMVKLLLNQEDKESAQALLDSLSDDDKKRGDVSELIAQMKLSEKLKDVGDPNELQQRIESNPDDLEAQLKMSHYMTAINNHEAAMQLLLNIMQKDRGFQDDAGRQGLLDLFELLGNDNPLVKTYRRRMFTLLH